MRSIYLFLAAASTALAFPAGLTFEHLISIQDRSPQSLNSFADHNPEFAALFERVKRSLDDAPLTARQGLADTESQCGTIPCTTFDAADQLVDVSPGSGHEYIAPGPGDIRGLCPGLNSAANHGFLPRNGIATIDQAITGLGEAYAVSTDLAAFLATFATVFHGDPSSQTFSIGGSFTPSALGGLLGGKADGIDASHNNFEADSSITRYDAYMNNGDSTSLNLTSFKRLLAKQTTDGLFTINSMQSQAIESREISIQNNPYFFSPPFAGVAVAPVAHYFVVRLMSNHTAENPDGYLDAPLLKSHFGITGEGDALTWTPGTERYPENWYRRPSAAAYDFPASFVDVVAGGVKYPELLVVGGNTGKPNSFAGVDSDDLTGGVYNSASITQGNNLGCFVLQTIKIGAPSVLAGVLSSTTQALGLLNGVLDPLTSKLGCPALSTYDQSQYDRFPGATYDSEGVARRYRL